MDIKRPGKYDDISLEEYHKLPAWSKTSLDKVNKSIAHYLEWKANPPESTPAQVFGAALHCAVLTPELYRKQYVVMPAIDRRTKDGKEAYAKFEKEFFGKSIISAEICGQVERIGNEIYNHPLCDQLLSNGEAEQSFFWTDPKTGLACKARPDYLRNDGICIDLKTCADAGFKDFQRAIYNFRYHVQGAFFMDGIFQAVQKQCSDFVLMAVEKEAPFGIMVYLLDDLAIDSGRVSYADNLLDIKQWQEHPEAYATVYQLSNSPVEISLPAWAE